MADVTSPFGFPYPEDTDLVRDGASDIENLAEGVNDYLTGGYLYAGTRYYESSGNFLKADPLGTGDIGLRAIRVRMVGGGGGGGGCSTTTAAGRNAVGGGGGGGAYAESLITDIASLDASVTVTRGSGGAGGAAGANAGSEGGVSSFGTVVVADSGKGGAAAGEFAVPRLFGVGVGGTGAAPSTGDLLYTGQSSPRAFGLMADFAGNTGGTGSAFSGGFAPQASATGADGGEGRLFGGGGGGGFNAQNQATARAGGAGRNGIVIVDCFV
jgi:hypothetical protein